MRQLVVLFLLVHGALARADLDGYVRRADASFAWTLDVDSSAADGTRYHLSLVSQTWRGGEWKHQLSLFVPAGARTSHALLFIGGSGQAHMRETALRLRAPVASLTDVPNQPLLGGLYEDDLIAETFVRYLRSGEEDWPLLLPMTKSAVRAMDALQALSRARLPQPIERFVLTGASKRGWTLDALDLYWDGLPGEKRVLYVPNAGHGLDGGEHWPDALACLFERVRAGQAMPEVDSSLSAEAQAAHLRAWGTPAPTGARLWHARAPQRDLREAAWSMQPMTRTADGYRASAARTPGDWTALLAILDFDVGGTRCTLSTRVSLLPPVHRAAQ